jgi:hypothetical protein
MATAGDGLIGRQVGCLGANDSHEAEPAHQGCVVSGSVSPMIDRRMQTIQFLKPDTRHLNTYVASATS